MGSAIHNELPTLKYIPAFVSFVIEAEGPIPKRFAADTNNLYEVDGTRSLKSTEVLFKVSSLKMSLSLLMSLYR